MKPMKRLEKKNKEGFTLIELVIVIALLAILMTLAVPAYKNLQEQARQNPVSAGGCLPCAGCVLRLCVHLCRLQHHLGR